MANPEAIPQQSHAIPRVSLEDPTIRVETKRHHLSRYSYAATLQPGDGKQALDLCSGTGYGTAILSSVGYTATGVDLNEEAVQSARAHYSGIQYEVGDVIQFLQSTHGQVDLVTFFEALEHVTYEQGLAVFSEVRRLLHPSGIFVVSTPRDIKSGENQWHITQWQTPELTRALESNFQQVSMHGQSWAEGDIFTLDTNRQADFYIATCKGPIPENAEHVRFSHN